MKNRKEQTERKKSTNISNSVVQRKKVKNTQGKHIYDSSL